MVAEHSAASRLKSATVVPAGRTGALWKGNKCVHWARCAMGVRVSTIRAWVVVMPSRRKTPRKIRLAEIDIDVPGGVLLSMVL